MICLILLEQEYMWQVYWSSVSAFHKGVKQKLFKEIFGTNMKCSYYVLENTHTRYFIKVKDKQSMIFFFFFFFQYYFIIEVQAMPSCSLFQQLCPNGPHHETTASSQQPWSLPTHSSFRLCYKTYCYPHGWRMQWKHSFSSTQSLWLINYDKNKCQNLILFCYNNVWGKGTY